MQNKFIQRYYGLIDPATPEETKADYDLMVSYKQGNDAGITVFRDKENKDFYSAIYSDGKTDYLLKEFLECFDAGKTDISFVDENGNFNHYTARFKGSEEDSLVTNTGYTMNSEGEVMLANANEVNQLFNTAFENVLKIEEMFVNQTNQASTEFLPQ